MKKVYICGDSFCVPDPEYGPCWVDHLAQHYNIVNASRVSATNLMISKMVDTAIGDQADFVIVQGTSCTRSQTQYQGLTVPYSFLSANSETTPFDSKQLHIIKQYYTEFFDLDWAIYLNQCVIQNTLQKLVDSAVPFRFDQGGFEHPKFAASGIDYFSKFNSYRSAINLWDHGDTGRFRPYYHITDSAVHRTVAEYYAKEIQ